MKVFGITGWKNSGKTHLMERLVKEFKSRNFSVSTIKNAHHGFDVDQPGKDSFRHRQAGAQEVIVASSKRWVLMHENNDDEKIRLKDLMKKLSKKGYDFVVFWEDDDWYHPKYLEWLIGEWVKKNKPNFFGVGETYYYNLLIGKSHHMPHPGRTSAFCTLIKLP